MYSKENEEASGKPSRDYVQILAYGDAGIPPAVKGRNESFMLNHHGARARQSFKHINQFTPCHKTGYPRSMNRRTQLIYTDSGIGIAKENLTKLGTPFFTMKRDRAGMDLTQVFSVVHHHNGRISVQSEIGNGTTFHICLPLTT